jgi:hypothetical protein
MAARINPLRMLINRDNLRDPYSSSTRPPWMVAVAVFNALGLSATTVLPKP